MPALPRVAATPPSARGGVAAPPAPPGASEHVALEGELVWPPRDDSAGVDESDHGGRGRGDDGDRGGGGGGGGGGSGGGGNEGDNDDPDGTARPNDPATTHAETIAFGVGLWMFALAVSFAIFLLASWALSPRGGGGGGGDATRTPTLSLDLTVRMLVSTLLLGLSSATVELARRTLATARPALARRWLARAQLLALGFLASQTLAWRALFGAGIRPSSSAFGTTFTTLTALHGAHIVGGLVYLFASGRRLVRADAAARQSLTACARYWHFLGILWLVLLGALLALH